MIIIQIIGTGKLDDVKSIAEYARLIIKKEIAEL